MLPADPRQQLAETPLPTATWGSGKREVSLPTVCAVAMGRVGGEHGSGQWRGRKVPCSLLPPKILGTQQPWVGLAGSAAVASGEEGRFPAHPSPQNSVYGPASHCRHSSHVILQEQDFVEISRSQWETGKFHFTMLKFSLDPTHYLVFCFYWSYSKESVLREGCS